MTSTSVKTDKEVSPEIAELTFKIAIFGFLVEETLDRWRMIDQLMNRFWTGRMWLQL
jgi:hypothetical protein